MRYIILLLLITACIASVGADPAQQITVTPGAIIGEDNQQPTAAPPPTATSEQPQPTAAPTFPDNVNPLTGLAVSDPNTLNRRPIVSKISNAPPLVRPQAGVGQADLIFEHYAEGGLTRLSGVFYSTLPERVGSVRSARIIDYELAAMYEAILVFSGGSTGVEELIYGSDALGIREARLAEGGALVPPSDFADRAYKGVLYGPPYYFRDETIPVPHNLFANLQAVSELATSDDINTRPTLNGMTFSDVPPEGEAGTANAVDVRYRATRGQWTYNPEQGVYLRNSDGQPHFDITTQEQVAVENVAIIYADHYFTDIVESEWQGSKSYSIEIKVWFEGDAVLVRDGRRYDVRWVRPTRESMLQLQTVDGNPLPFKPGQTWYQLVPLQELMDAESEWVRFE